MHEEIDHLGRLMAQGRLSRRDFLGRAAALGVSTALATTLAGRALAETPVKGGVLRAGMQGGDATDSLDPAAWASQVPYFFGRSGASSWCRCRPTARSKPALAEEWGASDDAKTWTFKIRKGVAVPQRQGDDAGRCGGDHRAPLRRELQVRRARHHGRHRIASRRAARKSSSR